MHARVDDSAAAGRPPIVMVHGLGVSSRYLQPTALLLARELHVHAVDLPGFGLSSKPDLALDVSQLAEALADWLTPERIEPAVVVANSFGCQVAAELAVRWPERVRGLILLAPTVDPQARSARRHAARWLVTMPFEPPSLACVVARDTRSTTGATHAQLRGARPDSRADPRLRPGVKAREKPRFL